MIVVSDTTPLIGLASIDRLELLKKLFGDIYIPMGVYYETFEADNELGRARKVVPMATWIQVVTVQDQIAVTLLLNELDLGEAETIVLAREINADWVLMDEKKGRRKLVQLGINKIGTIEILLKARQLGILHQVRPELEQLRCNGFSISQHVIDAVLLEAKE